MNGNDLLHFDMMKAHQQRLLDEADRLRLARGIERLARRGRLDTSAGGSGAPSRSSAGRPAAPPRRRPTTAHAPGHASGYAPGHVPGQAIRHASAPAPGHANGTARRRFGGVAGRIGATLVTLGTRLQRLEHGRDRGA